MGKGQNRRNNSGNMHDKEASSPKSGAKREKASAPSKKDEEGHKFIEKKQKEDSIEHHPTAAGRCVMNELFMMEFINSRSKSCEFPLRLFHPMRKTGVQTSNAE